MSFYHTSLCIAYTITITPYFLAVQRFPYVKKQKDLKFLIQNILLHLSFSNLPVKHIINSS